jgi:cell division septum initiation protein DivIVA
LFGNTPADVELPDQAPVMPDPEAQRQALQVLVLAQRTADEHVAIARHHADKIRTDALATGEQITREAQAHADGARRDAEKILSDARSRAGEIVKDAQARADGLDREAQQRYQDVVGTLATKRAALQQQIEAMQQFDRDYRSRLRTFMQGQLEALGVDEPPPVAPARPAGAGAKGGPAPEPE